MSVPKPFFRSLTNPGLPRNTRVLINGQEGTIVDQTHSRMQRLIMMRGSLVPAMTDVTLIAKAWIDGNEFTVGWNPGKALTPYVPPLTREQAAD